LSATNVNNLNPLIFLQRFSADWSNLNTIDKVKAVASPVHIAPNY
jgi:hypothetical protein